MLSKQSFYKTEIPELVRGFSATLRNFLQAEEHNPTGCPKFCFECRKSFPRGERLFYGASPSGSYTKFTNLPTGVWRTLSRLKVRLRAGCSSPRHRRLRRDSKPKQSFASLLVETKPKVFFLPTLGGEIFCLGVWVPYGTKTLAVLLKRTDAQVRRLRSFFSKKKIFSTALATQPGWAPASVRRNSTWNSP